MKVKSKINKKLKKENGEKENHAVKEEKIEKEQEIEPVKTKKNKKIKVEDEIKVPKSKSEEKKKKKKNADESAEETEQVDPESEAVKSEELDAPQKKKKRKSEAKEEPTEVKSEELETPKKKKKKDSENDENEEKEEKTLAYDREDEKKTVFCGNIPNESGITKSKIKELFSQYGKIKTLRMRSETGNILFSHKNKKSCTSFNAYVVFETIEDAKKSLQLHGYKLMENHLRVNMANDKQKAFQTKGTVFAGNLPFDATEKEVHAFFGKIGEIDYVRIIPRKGIAYIAYRRGVSIINALKLNESEFQGRNIRVTRYESKPKQEKKKRFTRDPKTGRRIKLRVKKTHKLDENFVKGRGANKTINNPIIKKIRDSQKAKFNKFTDNANQVSKKDLFRRGGKIEADNRDVNRMKFKQKTKFFGSKVGDEKKVKKNKISKVAKDQKIIAKKLKSTAMRK